MISAIELTQIKIKFDSNYCEPDLLHIEQKLT